VLDQEGTTQTSGAPSGLRMRCYDMYHEMRSRQMAATAGDALVPGVGGSRIDPGCSVRCRIYAGDLVPAFPAPHKVQPYECRDRRQGFERGPTRKLMLQQPD
jgi:hypothetical protein